MVTLLLPGYPTELVPFVTSPISKSRIFPELEIDGEIFESLCDVMEEIVLFYSIEKDDYKQEYYAMNLPHNPLNYYGENKSFFDATKYRWYQQWLNVKPEVIYKQRLQVINLLDNLKVINVNYNPPKNNILQEYFHIKMNFYPQAEGFSSIYGRSIDTLYGALTSLREQKEKEGYVDVYKNGEFPTLLDAQLKQAMNIKYWLDFYMDGKIVLNGKYLISQPHLETENDKFFDFIVKKSKHKILKGEIEKQIGILKNPLSKIIYDLGFTGEIKKLFFPRVSNNAVIFNNQIKEEDLQTLGVNESELFKQIKELKSL